MTPSSSEAKSVPEPLPDDQSDGGEQEVNDPQTAGLGRLRGLLSRRRNRILFLVAGLVIMVAGWNLLVREFNRPLGPPLPILITRTPLPLQIGQIPTATPTPTATATAMPSPTILPTGTPEPLCGGPEQMTILAVGADSSYGYERGLADVIRVVRINFVTPSISVLTIHRDTWVSIPGLGEYGGNLEEYFGHPFDPDSSQEIVVPGDYGRVNSAYFYGNLYDLPGGGPGTLAQTIYQNFGLPVDHYIATDMNIFAKAVDAVGGVEIYLPYDIGDFPAGTHHMTGEEALDYARIREPDSDIYRNKRQNQLLLALWKQLLRPQTIAAVPTLIDAFHDDVLTDLSKAQISSLACLATKVDNDDIIFYRLTDMLTATYTTRGSFVLLPDEDYIRAYLAVDFLAN
jgi:LCP family protein required for cell wall assembly